MNPFMVRQGDVLIVACEVPANAQPVPGTRIVLAEGEQTGHAHVLVATKVGDAELLSVADQIDRFLRVRSRAEVCHEEHDTIVLPPGEYRVVRQREYSPEAIRRVAD